MLMHEKTYVIPVIIKYRTYKNIVISSTQFSPLLYELNMPVVISSSQYSYLLYKLDMLVSGPG